jgi:hypothetical protein
MTKYDFFLQKLPIERVTWTPFFLHNMIFFLQRLPIVNEWHMGRNLMVTNCSLLTMATHFHFLATYNPSNL